MPQEAAFRMAGGLDTRARMLRFDAIQLQSPGGDLEGEGEMHLIARMPAMRFEMRSKASRRRDRAGLLATFHRP